MEEFEPTKISSIKKIWEAEGFTFKKALSQNFLIDQNIVDKILNSAEIKDGDTILEIGPGSGAITFSMLKRGATVYACEIDSKAIAILTKYLSDFENFHLINKDILKLDLSILPKNIKVVSNLPYHITSPIIAKLTEIIDSIESITIMVQKEMAERITASPPSRNRSSFSIFTSFYFDKKTIFTVKPGCFIPRPKVDSVILSLIPKDSLPNVNHEKFFQFVRLCFSQKRKQVSSIVKHENLKESLSKLGLDHTIRAEKITTDQFIQLYELLYSPQK